MPIFFRLPDFVPSTSKMLFPVCRQGGRNPGVLSVCVDPKLDLQTLLAFFIQLLFFVHWRTSAEAICLLGFVSGIQRDFSITVVLSCVILVAAIGGSTFAEIALTGSS